MKLKLLVALVAFFVVTQAHADPTYTDVTLAGKIADDFIFIPSADFHVPDVKKGEEAVSSLQIEGSSNANNATYSTVYMLIGQAVLLNNGKSYDYKVHSIDDTDVTFGSMGMYGANTASGQYAIQWTNTGVPVSTDFWVIVQAASGKEGFEAYHFSNVVLDTTTTILGETFLDDWSLEFGKKNDTLGALYVYVGQPYLPLNNPPAVPEPATMLLFGAGLAGLAGISRRRLRNR